MGHAAVSTDTVLLALAAGELYPLVYGADNICDGDLVCIATEIISATRTAHATHQAFATQRCKQLLERRERNALVFGNVGQGHRAIDTVECQVEHRRYRVTSFG